MFYFQGDNRKMNFTEIGVNENIVKALAELNITEPTQIQIEGIPLAQKGKDVIGMSRTGSGKTLAFGVPALEIVEPGKGLQVLIMTPTRELAHQISEELNKFGKYTKFNQAVVYGGVAMDPQIRKMNKADIVVATPGRLLDHMRRGNVNFSKIKSFVLDEADKMVEMGFIEDIEQILSQTPRNRQILLFGATISREVDYIKGKYMHDSVVVEAQSQVEQELLEQYYYNVDRNEKFSFLLHLLKNEDIHRAIVFCSKRSTVDLVARNLRENGIKVEYIHGKLTQNKRLHVIENFNKGKIDIIIASAVAARGLHIDGVSHVINYDLPNDPQEYIHRIGRTARAGQSGKAISLLAPVDYDVFNRILDRYPVEVKELDKGEFARVRFNAAQRDDRRGPRYASRGRAHPGRRHNDRSGGNSRFGGRSRESNSARSPSRFSGQSENRFGSRNSGSSQGKTHSRRKKW